MSLVRVRRAEDRTLQIDKNEGWKLGGVTRVNEGVGSFTGFKIRERIGEVKGVVGESEEA
jgi:hypothetical protein